MRKLDFSLIGLKEGQALEKVSVFFGAHFSCERDGHPTFKFYIDSEVLLIYRLIPRKFDFLEWLAALGTTTVNRFLGAPRSVHGSIQPKSACFWVSVKRNALDCVACEI
jgi:hypothetical protein